ncbi:MAG: site-2 protease family protein [Gemmataceae bacterium]
MFGNRWQLFRLLGIPIRIDLSWVIIFLLLSWTLVRFFQEALAEVRQTRPEAVPEMSPTSYWLLGVGGALVFFGCILLHEMGHAVVARRRGIPIRGITLFLFGGVAEMEGEPKSPGDEFWVAVAGPLVTVALIIFFGALWLWLPIALPIHMLLGYLAVINLLVLVFNMVPAFPLDGGRVLRSILWAASGNLRRATYLAALSGQGFAWFLIFVGILQFISGNFFGIWFGLIGLFLNMAARGSYQQVLIRQMLEGEKVRNFMTPEPIAVPPHIDLRHWVEDYVYRYHRKVFPVTDDGRVQGIVSTQALAQFPRGEWDQHTVAEVMQPDTKNLTITPDADALHALSKMQRSGFSRLLVMEGDRLVGIISLKDLLRFLDMKMELEQVEGNMSGR